MAVGINDMKEALSPGRVLGSLFHRQTGGKGLGIWYDFNNDSDNTNRDQAVDLAFGRNENNTTHSHSFAGSDPFPNHAQGSGMSIEEYSGDYRHRGSVVNPDSWKNAGQKDGVALTSILLDYPGYGFGGLVRAIAYLLLHG